MVRGPKIRMENCVSQRSPIFAMCDTTARLPTPLLNERLDCPRICFVDLNHHRLREAPLPTHPKKNPGFRDEATLGKSGT